MKPCQIPGCGRDSAGFVCGEHWHQVPVALREKIRQARDEYQSAQEMSDRMQSRHSLRVLAQAKRTVYNQIKTQALHLLDAHNPTCR